MTPRQEEVIRLVATGISNKEIAKVLMISERTVRTHLSKLYKGMGVNNRCEALCKLGWVVLPGEDEMANLLGFREWLLEGKTWIEELIKESNTGEATHIDESR